jgi:hypothetical protein
MGVVEHIRKVAAIEEGRRSFQELTAPGAPRALDVVLMKKAGAADPALLAIAGAIRPARPLAMYEELGGIYRQKER